MNSKLERLEVERATARNDDFAVEDAPRGKLRAQGGAELGEVAVERLLVAALDEKLVAVAKDEDAKAVPLRLEDPLVAGWQFGDAFGEHRSDRRRDGEPHVRSLHAAFRGRIGER